MTHARRHCLTTNRCSHNQSVLSQPIGALTTNRCSRFRLLLVLLGVMVPSHLPEALHESTLGAVQPSVSSVLFAALREEHTVFRVFFVVPGLGASRAQVTQLYCLDARNEAPKLGTSLCVFAIAGRAPLMCDVRSVTPPDAIQYRTTSPTLASPLM